jgi:hypothetical protein
MGQGVENRTHREVMWLHVLVPEHALIECNYHLASTQIRYKHRLVIVEHQTRVYWR